MTPERSLRCVHTGVSGWGGVSGVESADTPANSQDFRFLMYLFLALASYFWTCMLTPILCLFILGSLAICFLIVKMILDIIEIYHREINFRYYLSLDNWYYNYVVEYVDHLYIGFCFKLSYFLPRSVFALTPTFFLASCGSIWIIWSCLVF